MSRSRWYQSGVLGTSEKSYLSESWPGKPKPWSYWNLLRQSSKWFCSTSSLKCLQTLGLKTHRGVWKHEVILKFQDPWGSDDIHVFAPSAPSRTGLGPDWQRGLQQNHVKYSQRRSEVPVAQICQPDVNQSRHPRWQRIHILAKRLTNTLFLDSVYIWKKVNKKVMDRTFLIHTLYSRGSTETLFSFFF